MRWVYYMDWVDYRDPTMVRDYIIEALAYSFRYGDSVAIACKFLLDPELEAPCGRACLYSYRYRELGICMGPVVNVPRPPYDQECLGQDFYRVPVLTDEELNQAFEVIDYVKRLEG